MICQDCGKPATINRDDQTRCDECHEQWFADEFAYHCRHAYDPRLDSGDTSTRLKAYLELKEPWKYGG